MTYQLPAISTHYPQSELCRKYVQYYYFLSTDDRHFDTAYYVFPNTNTSITLHRQVDYDINEKGITVTGNADKSYVPFVQGIRQRPVYIRLSGVLDKITIAFHPFGLNHFIRGTYQQVAGKHTQVLQDWEQQPVFKKFTSDFYSTGQQEERISLLESFLELLYQPAVDAERLVDAIPLLCDRAQENTVAEVAMAIGMSERHFSRLFTRELGLSPVQFKKIARFRHSLNNKLFHKQFERLTRIGYDSNYYDQAYFTNIYRKLTQKNPAAFFRSVERLADDNLVLSFLKNG